MDPFAVEVRNGEVATVVFTAGDALGDALVRPGRVVVHLVFGQDGAQVALAEDQHPVEEFSAQGAGEALADRVHPRSLDSGTQDPGTGNWPAASTTRASGASPAVRRQSQASAAWSFAWQRRIRCGDTAGSMAN